MSRKILAVVFILLAGVVPASEHPAAVVVAPAGTLQPLSLGQALGLALASHPLLLEAAARERQAAAVVRDARSPGEWQVKAEARRVHLSEVPGLPAFPPILRLPRIAFGHHVVDTGIVSAQRLLSSGGRVEAGVAQARHTLGASAAATRRVRQRVAFEAERSFLQLVLAQREAEVASQALATAQAYHRVARSRFAARSSPQFDVLRAEVQVEESRHELLRAESLVITARAALGQALARPGSAWVALETGLLAGPVGGAVGLAPAAGAATDATASPARSADEAVALAGSAGPVGSGGLGEAGPGGDRGGPLARGSAGPGLVAADNSLQVRGLCRSFSGVAAVAGVDLDIRSGEIFGLVGPDGAGKTTTLRLLCGILEPDAGEAAIGGVSVRRDPEGVKRSVGYMSQRFSLYGDLTVAENIYFFANLFHVPEAERRRREEQLLAASRMTPFRDRLARNLSGGMKQKLALTCTLVHHPRILFLDEPTSGVDPISRRSFWELIYAMAAAGTTVFVTTHVMDEAEHCDRLAMIDRGRLIALGSPATLKESSLPGVLLEIEAEPLMAALSLLERETATGSGATDATPIRELAVFGASLHALVADEAVARAAIARALAEGGVGLTAIGRITPSLEDVFVSLVEHGSRAHPAAPALGLAAAPAAGPGGRA